MSLEKTVSDCKLIDLPQIHNRQGNITPLNGNTDWPFDIKRVYYLYDVPSGESRGGHAHKTLNQLIIAASGSFNVVINDGIKSVTVTLNSPSLGLHLVPGMWRELKDFSSGAICLVMASAHFDESDYIRDYDDYKKYIHENS